MTYFDDFSVAARVVVAAGRGVTKGLEHDARIGQQYWQAFESVAFGLRPPATLREVLDEVGARYCLACATVKVSVGNSVWTAPPIKLYVTHLSPVMTMVWLRPAWPSVVDDVVAVPRRAWYAASLDPKMCGSLPCGGAL